MQSQWSVSQSLINPGSFRVNKIFALTYFTDILSDLLEKVASGSIRPHVVKKLSMENAVDYLISMKSYQMGKVIVQFP